MSFGDKISMLMSRPGGDNVQKDDVPWMLRYAGRGLGTVGSFKSKESDGYQLALTNHEGVLLFIVCIILGLFNCLGIFLLQAGCLLAGIWQILSGFIVLVCEAPCCCFFIDYVQTLSDKLESRPYWNKAVFYVGLAIPPFFMCLGIGTFFASGLIFATGIVYGMMALGRKASAEEMRTATIEAGLAPPTAPGVNLVANEQPVSFTSPARH